MSGDSNLSEEGMGKRGAERGQIQGAQHVS